MQNKRGIELVRAQFYSVPLENAPHYKPYQAVFGEEDVQAVVTATEGGRRVGSNVFSHISGRILAPTTQSQGIINIQYGWDERRYSVLLEFRCRSQFGVKERHVLTGYTNSARGISASGLFADDMEIYINSHTSSKECDSDIGPANRIYYESSGSRQVLNSFAVDNLITGRQQTIGTTMRPVDAMNVCMVNSLADRDENGGLSDFSAGGKNIDYRPQTEDIYKPSMRDNVMANRYLSKFCRGYQTALVQNPVVERSNFDETDGVFGDAAIARELAEEDASKNQIFSKLIYGTEYGNKRSITIKDIAYWWPQFKLDEVTTVYNISTGNLVDNTNYYEGWNGATQETNLAYVLSQTIPALMSNLLIQKYSFNVHNRTLDGTVNVTTTGVRYVVDILNSQERIIAMESSILNEVVGYVMSNGVGDFNIRVTCDMQVSIIIEITLGTQPTHQFSAPTWCDSLYSPVMGENKSALENLGSTLGYMLTNMYADSHRSSNRSPIPSSIAHAASRDPFDDYDVNFNHSQPPQSVGQTNQNEDWDGL